MAAARRAARAALADNAERERERERERVFAFFEADLLFDLDAVFFFFEADLPFDLDADFFFLTQIILRWPLGHDFLLFLLEHFFERRVLPFLVIFLRLCPLGHFFRLFFLLFLLEHCFERRVLPFLVIFLRRCPLGHGFLFEEAFLLFLFGAFLLFEADLLFGFLLFEAERERRRRGMSAGREKFLSSAR
jgi:hypothetical protein